MAQSPVLVAWGEGSHHDMPTKTAIETAIKLLTDRVSLCRGQPGDPILCRASSDLLRKRVKEDYRNQRVHKDYLLDDNDIMWNSPLGEVPVLAVHQNLISDLTPLIHANMVT